MCRIIKKKELFQYMMFAMVILSIVLRHTYFTSYTGDDRNIADNILSLLRYFAMMFGLFQIILYSQFNLKQWSITGLCLVCACVSTYFSKDKAVVMNTIAVIALIDAPKDKLIKELLVISGTVLFITVLFSQIGILPNLFRDAGVRNRYMLGFKWPTYGPAVFFFCVIDYAILKHGKIKKAFIFIILLINYFLWKFTNTNSVFYELLLLMVIFFIFGGKFNRIGLLKSRLMVLVPWFAALLSFVMAYIYDSDIAILSRLNSIFTHRLYYGNVALQKYGISIFGQYVEWSELAKTNALSANNLCVDSSFLDLLIRKGAIFLIIVLSIYSVIIQQLIQKKEYGTIVITMFVIMFCITEPWLINIALNPIPLILYKDSKNNRIQSSKKTIKS